jgi:hypothetical protein
MPPDTRARSTAVAYGHHRDRDKVNMRPASTAAPSSTHRWLACAVAVVRTEMGDRGLSHGRLAAVGDALRSRRAADRLLHPLRMAGLQGGS